MTDGPQNCWEVKECGRGPDGSLARTGPPCPAAVDAASDGINRGTNAGRFCWAVSGTLCDGQPAGSVEDKMCTCAQCRFFKRVKYEEGVRFQLLKPGVGVADAGQLHRMLNSVVTLVSICRDVMACLAERPLLAQITQHAHSIMGASSVSAYVLSESGEELIRQAWSGSAERPDRIGPEAQVAVAETLRLRRLCVAIEPAAENNPTRVVAALPVSARERPVGVLELVKPGDHLSSDDEWFFRQFGLIAGLGIGNARFVADIHDLKEYDKAKSRFVALLMHQISSPLATVACSLRALDKLGDKLAVGGRRELIRNSLDRVAGIHTLARKLLDLAAIRSGHSLGDIQPTSVADVVSGEVAARLARARDAGVKIVTTSHAPTSRVDADPDGLRLIFGNLLDNAVKYSNGMNSSVAVHVAERGGRVRVLVCDRGIGIPTEEQASIFQEFHRAGNVGASGASGSGLGLAIVKELVDRYGGDIEVESALGAGTTVTVEFPCSTGTEPGGEPA